MSAIKTFVVLTAMIALAGAIGAQFVEAQQGDPKKDEPQKKQPDAKEKPKIKLESKPKVDHFPQITEKVKKYEADVAKLRDVLLKEIADEETKVNEAIKKAEQDKKDKDAFKARIELAKKRTELGQIRFHVESGKVGYDRPDEERRFGMHLGALHVVAARQLGLDKEKGIVVEKIDSDSPADKAGLKAYDILLTLDGKDLPSGRKDALRFLAEVKAGTPVEVVIVRGGKQEKIAGLVIPAPRKGKD